MKTRSLLVLFVWLVAPLAATAQDLPVDLDELELVEDPVVVDDDGGDDAPPPAPPAAVPAAARAAPVDEARFRAALAHYARIEPTVDEVVASALRVQTADPSRARDAMSRLRLSGWVPTVRVGVRRGFGEGLTAQDLATGERTALSATDSLALDGSLTFRLDRLVFAREETALMREERALVRERLRVARDVIALWFERRRLQLERDLLAMNDLGHAMRIVEAESLLDVFTAGAFTRMMRQRRSGGTGGDAP